MDPGIGRSITGRPGIPRTRGDGPLTGAGRVTPKRDSPHPRGWTLVDFVPPRRPRDSPHPRGWTVPEAFLAACRHGFPAPAGMNLLAERHEISHVWIPRPRGMDPRASGSPPRSRRIPRTCGDGPQHEILQRVFAEDSPHSRGWTRAGAAGRRRIPRPRGDGQARTSLRSRRPPGISGAACWRGRRTSLRGARPAPPPPAARSTGRCRARRCSGCAPPGSVPA